MNLYVWDVRPRAYGSYSYVVMAETEEAARAAVTVFCENDEYSDDIRPQTHEAVQVCGPGQVFGFVRD